MQQITFASLSTARRGFSLLELLLVIFIISLVYFLGFEALGKNDESASSFLAPETLLSEIRNNKLFQGSGTLLCTDNCTQCYFRKDISSPFKSYEGKIALKGTEAYALNRDQSLEKIEYGRYKDQKICLLMHFYTNGSSTKLVLKSDKGFFLLPSYLGTTQHFTSLEEAQNAWIGASSELSRRGDFY